MCTEITNTTAVAGSGKDGDDWFQLTKAVVYFDHPQDAPAEHALCIDLWDAATARRVAVELDPDSARRLAETILATIEVGGRAGDVEHVLQPVAVTHQRGVG
jgi:hypothetical protein